MNELKHYAFLKLNASLPELSKTLFTKALTQQTLSTITLPTSIWISILNLWELRQILCKTEFPPLFLGGGGGGEVQKTFLYQKNILFASKKTHSCWNT
ncbi:hypothetical protein AYB34_06485 [Leptospira sp. ZV016]|nr:hypothetical protein AYB32_07600 [Leptospira kirschneri]KXZ25164.1 hypothetical protein AYB34_06485 [Leptospira sp. ZV016]